MNEDPALTPDQQLAGEFALGLLDGERLLMARGKLAREPRFADEVARWEERFTPMLDSWESAEPPSRLWQNIDAALDGEADAGPSAHPVDLAKLRRSRDRWRLVGGLSLAGAAALAIAIFVLPGGSTPFSTVPAGEDAPLLAASIPIADTPLRLALTYVPERAQLSVSSTGLAPDGVHDHELWLVDRTGQLHSLGVIQPGEEARFAIGEGLADEFAAGSRLVLTREPLGGKPGDVEAGPVVAEGQFTAI